MSPLDAQSARPLHLQLADELLAAIRCGDLGPGERLPPEHDLVETYATSRTTVRLALGVLKTESLIASGPGRGTFVRDRPRVRLTFSRFTRRQREAGLGQWQAEGQRAGVHGEVRAVAVEQHTADAELACRFGIDEEAPLILRKRHMLADGFLLQLYDGYYPLELVEGTEIATSPFVTGGIYAALERLGHSPNQATEEIGARAPTPAEAALLRLGTGVPVLTATRTTRSDSGRVLEVLKVVANGRHPAHRVPPQLPDRSRAVRRVAPPRATQRANGRDHAKIGC